MPYVSRRSLVRFLGAAAVAGGGVTAAASPALAVRPGPRTGDNPVVRENLATGSDAWSVGHGETSGVTSKTPEIQGYASATSVAPGASLDFHLASHRAQKCTVSVFRVGHYSGAGARHLLTGEPVAVRPGAAPKVSRRTGAVACGWPVSWKLDVPSGWVSGIHLAVFTTEDGFRSFTPFVVREESRTSDVLAVLPFTGYQVDNVWPLHPGAVTGDGPLQVSFDRPFAGLGLPAALPQDTALARWVEEAGYDVTYASSLDLHEGRVGPGRYTAVVVSGKEAHWSREMRDGLTAAVASGTRLALVDADGVPGRVRLGPSADGRPGRLLTRRPVGFRTGTGIRLSPGTVGGAGSWPWQDGTGDSLPAATGHGVRVDEDARGRLVLRAGAVAGGPAWALALGEPEHVDGAVGGATGRLFDRLVGEPPRRSVTPLSA